MRRAKGFLPAGIPALGCLGKHTHEQHLHFVEISHMTLLLERSHTRHIAMPHHTPGALARAT